MQRGEGIWRLVLRQGVWRMKSPIVPLSRSEEERQSGSEAGPDGHTAHNLFYLKFVRNKGWLAEF